MITRTYVQNFIKVNGSQLMEYCKISPKISKSAPEQGFCVYDLWGNAKKIPEVSKTIFSGSKERNGHANQGANSQIKITLQESRKITLSKIILCDNPEIHLVFNIYSFQTLMTV